MDESVHSGLRVVSALWYSNFRNIEIRENGNIYVLQDRFGTNALNLLLDLAVSYRYDLEIYSNNAGQLRAAFFPK